MNVNSRVILKSFNGTVKPPSDCDPGEGFWKLIGHEGVVIQDPFKCCKDDRYSDERKVLVKFDVSLDSFGLCSSNHVKNSLWILVSDLSGVIDG